MSSPAPPPSVLGLHCPYCGHDKYDCTDSRPAPYRQRRRRHKCQRCTKSFTTLERLAAVAGNTPLRSSFNLGDLVRTRALHSFHFEGIVIAVYQKTRGKAHRYVVENADGQDVTFFTHSLEAVR